jgi:dimethylglycine dehydrogenase
VERIDMRNQARCVIVGGGIMGVSLLYHLAKEGWTDSVLIEKAELTSGSTWHAAGQITHGLANWGLGKINVYGVELYRDLETLTGQNATWHGCGSMRVAYTDDELDFCRHILSVGKGLGVAIDLIDVAEAKKHHPFFNFDGVKAVLHTPEDGHVDPAGATFGLAKGARDLGAEVVRHNRVTNIMKLPDGAWKVETEQGDIICEHVVNAGGTYAKQVAEWVGYNLPMANTTHHYFVTDAVAEFKDLDRELPVVRDDMTYSGYIRMEQKSGLIGIYEKTDPRTIWDDGTPWEAEHELFDADYDRIMPFLEHALERMPILAEYGIKREVHGAIPMPPDGNMLLGPAPGLENFWCCCGSHVGIAWGPGAGKYLAQWMVHGSAEINMRDFDPRRFGPYADDRDYQIARAKEDYVLRHEIPYPGRQRWSGRPVKKSPLYARLKEAGAVHEEIFGWERPRWFTLPDQTKGEEIYGFRRPDWQRAVAEECKAVRERVGVADLTAFAKIDVSGPGAEAFMDRMIANRPPKKVGGIVLSHVLNRRGTIEAEVTVARIAEDRFYIVTAAFFELRLRDILSQARTEADDVRVEDVTEDFGVLAMSGPRSRDVLRQCTQAPLDNDSWPWLKAREIDVAGAQVRALRMSYQGELGWELHIPMDKLADVYDALWAAGAPHGIANFGSYALNAMRLEKGFKGAGELTNEVTLPEADVMRFVKLQDRDFVGKDATEKSQARAVAGELPWVCVYMEVDADGADPHSSETIYHNGARVGQVSSGGFGLYTGKSLAFGYVSRAAAAPGTALEVMVLGEKRPATVLAEPVYDPGNERPRM